MPQLAGMFDLRDNPAIDMSIAQSLGGAIGQGIKAHRIQQEEQYNEILQGEFVSVLNRASDENWDGGRILTELGQVRNLAKTEFGRQMQKQMIGLRMQQLAQQQQRDAEMQGLSPDEILRSRRIAAGLEPRAAIQKPASQSELMATLTRKMIEGTATDREEAIFDRLSKAGGATVNINTADVEKSADVQAQTLTILQEQADAYNQAHPDARQKMVVKSSAQSGKTFLSLEDKETASAGEREAIAGNLASMDALDNIEALKKSSYVGPIQGRVSQFKQTFGGAKEDQAQLVSALAAFRNQLIKQITGAQMSEPEARRIMQQIPKITDPDTVFDSNLKETRKNMGRVRQRLLEVMGKTGLASPTGGTEPPAPELAPYWNELTTEDKNEVNTILQSDPSKLAEILRRLQ